MADILSDIEQRIQDRLRDKGLPARNIKIEKGSAGLASPRVSIAADEGAFKPVAQNAAWRCDVTVYVDVVFKNVQSDAARREGIHPLLTGILFILAGQKLGLDIDPLQPQRFQNVTTLGELQAGELVFQLLFRTGYTLRKADEEKAADLIKVGLGFFLQEPAPAGEPAVSAEFDLQP